MQLKYGEEEYGFMPKSYILPQQCKQANQELFPHLHHNTTNNNNSTPNDNQQIIASPPPSTWIIKPYDSSRGRGIYLLNTRSRGEKLLSESKQCILAQYIDNPLLIDQLKFDLR